MVFFLNPVLLLLILNGCNPNSIAKHGSLFTTISKLNSLGLSYLPSRGGLGYKILGLGANENVAHLGQRMSVAEH